jgi:hypothetical protein
MIGFTASKYLQLVSDKKPKVDMSQLDKALIEGFESFTFCQDLRDSKEELEKEINTYLEKFKDNSYKIVSKVETLEPNGENSAKSFTSKVTLNIIQKPVENIKSVYLKDQAKKFEKETKGSKKSKYDKRQA